MGRAVFAVITPVNSTNDLSDDATEFTLHNNLKYFHEELIQLARGKFYRWTTNMRDGVEDMKACVEQFIW